MRVLLALSFLAACAEPRTEIALVIDTDAPNADSFRVTVVHPSGRTSTSSADLSSLAPPRTLVLLHEDGPLGPLRLGIEALDAIEPIIAVQREVSFQEGRSLTLHVFLPRACETLGCAPSETCGNRGECRAPAVDPCEYEGACANDAAIDASIDARIDFDAGDCTLAATTVCGVAESHLAGDRVTPAPCAPDSEAYDVTIAGPGGSLGGTGDPSAFRLSEAGPHRVRIALASNSACAIEREIDVATPVGAADDRDVASGELRDLGARVGTAFVAGERGAYAVDASGWYDLYAIGAGDMGAADFRAVAVLAGQPIFGPDVDENAIYRVITSAPFGGAHFDRIELPPGGREVRSMCARVDGAEPLIIATAEGPVLVRNLGAGGDARPNAPMGDPDIEGYCAIATSERSSNGAIWIGVRELVANASTSGGDAFRDGAPATVPSWIAPVYAAIADDRDPSAPRLWLCGEGGVASYDLEAGFDASAWPSEIDRWDGHCDDFAMGEEGDLWIASGDEGLVRLDPRASEILRYGSAQGLGPGVSVDHVATAWTGARRETWILDASAQEIFVFSAPPIP